MIRLLIDAPFSATAMFLGSLVGCGYAMVQAVRVATAMRWPTVEGEILSAYLVQNGFDTRGLYERVTYRYDVGGQRFVNDRVRFGPQPQRVSIVPAAGHPPATTAIGEQYPVGRPVRVRYNPRRPQDSVLHAQPNLTVFVIIAATAVCLFVGVRGVFGPR